MKKNNFIILYLIYIKLKNDKRQNNSFINNRIVNNRINIINDYYKLSLL